MFFHSNGFEVNGTNNNGKMQGQGYKLTSDENDHPKSPFQINAKQQINNKA